MAGEIVNGISSSANATLLVDIVFTSSVMFPDSVPSVGSLAPEFLARLAGKYDDQYEELHQRLNDRGAKLPSRPAAVPSKRRRRAWHQRAKCGPTSSSTRRKDSALSCSRIQITRSQGLAAR